MNSYPDFSSYGYQIQKELGKNLTGGRVTYLATDFSTNDPVVIKQFQFAKSTGTWNEYQAIHREIEFLENLNHPSIPRYLNSFDPPTGICLVQEYKKAPSLASSSQFTPEEIKQIAIGVLEVLVYLQQQHPPLIHRDIKPENILVDHSERASLKVYLVDFGFATLGERELESSIAKGTLGFMPPEQFRNQKLSPASDLYSLGVTLICLLTGTKSENVWNLIDTNNRINFKKIKLPKLNRSFIHWLKKMVEPELNNRFSNAETALRALKLGQVAGKVESESFKFKPKLIKRTAVGLLTLGVLALVVYKGHERAEKMRIVAEQQRQEELRKQQEELRQQLLEVERKRLEAEKKTLVLKLQETKACVGCDLSSANLEGLFLENVNLQAANLKGANLSAAKLKGAILSRANLQGANLSSTDLNSANLQGVNLQQADLSSTDLNSANLQGANLQDADLAYASLSKVSLKNANLKNTNFKGMYTGANLEGADLEGANLENANLENADLGNANMKNANLKNANLNKASLYGANLEGANTVGATFKGASR